MSEYQYYEFRAVDKPLTATQLKRLRALSTRAAISPTSFVNTYEWGDFKDDPSRLIEQMFDAFLYWANWGTRLFQVRLPGNLGNLKRIKPYCVGPFARVRAHGKDLILEFTAGETSDDYYDDEEDDWMGSLLPLRQDVLRGDYRCLYLAWLRSVQEEKVEDGEHEPPLPEGRRDMSDDRGGGPPGRRDRDHRHRYWSSRHRQRVRPSQTQFSVNAIDKLDNRGDIQ